MMVLETQKEKGMAIKQIFSAYKMTQNDPHDQFKYCPMCSTMLTPIERGGRPRPACPACGFVHFRNPMPGVVVVIEKDGKVLLGKRSGSFGTGKWGLPQGYIEFDEDYLTAAIREVKEETGLAIEIHSILNVVSNFLAPGVHTLAIILLAKVLDGAPTAGDDLETLAWFPLAGPLPDMAFEADTAIIQHVNQTQHQARLPVDPDYASNAQSRI